ncbi:DUF3027 domain-containing protein [Nakamurella sp.]|uniref:DUF3027 domain-containing protein n=1 Tax=Nakamurella sp. TaxID=1869182 RepID=UPI003783D6F1
MNPVVPDTAGPDSSTTHPAAPVSEPVALADDLIELARAAAAEEAGDERVGDYLGAWSEDSVATSARFAAADRGYRGWYWLVTVAIVEPAHPTISEVVLLPGDGALLAPAWVPWDQRVRAGDLGPGDLLPPPEDDERLVPGYLDSDDPAVREVDYEFGFGRVRVLGREGRDEAAQRWHDGSFGPSDPMAKQAPASCGTCGFYVRLEGLLGQAFGACSNEFSPADGRVVDAAYGCGAHSEVVVDAPLISASTATVMDEVTLDVHRRPTAATPASVDPALEDPAAPAAAQGPGDAGAAAPNPDDEVGRPTPAEPEGESAVGDAALRSEVGVAEVGVPEVGVPEVGVAEVAAPEVGVAEVAAPEVGVAEVEGPEVAADETATSEPTSVVLEPPADPVAPPAPDESGAEPLPQS